MTHNPEILLKELRRGADRAAINCITLSVSKSWLALTSDKGTVHVFAIKPTDEQIQATNVKSSFSFVGNVLPAYFSSEWSLAQFRVPDYRSVVAFGSHPHTCVIVCANGSVYKVRFNPHTGGDMVKESFSRFDDASVNPHGEDDFEAKFDIDAKLDLESGHENEVAPLTSSQDDEVIEVIDRREHPKHPAALSED